MIPSQSVSEVLAMLAGAKAGATDFVTNFFPAEKKLQDWISRGELLAESRSQAVLFFRRDRDFFHLYFAAADRTALEAAIHACDVIKNEKLVLDVVGKSGSLDELLSLLCESGFRAYTQLQRMARMPGQTAGAIAGDQPLVALAEQDDAGEILRLLETAFNVYGEQVPLEHELEAAIDLKQILICKQAGTVAGLLFFETQGVSSTLRFWTVAEQFRSLKLGSALMRSYFASQSAVKRFSLWVAANNLNAITKYNHYGYQPDGLVDYVLANQRIRT